MIAKPVENNAELDKIEDQIRRLKEKKRLLAEKEQAEKNELAKKVGLLILERFQGKNFSYEELKKALEETLTSDFGRGFFGMPHLPEFDPRRPKRRGRKKIDRSAKESIEETEE